MKSFSDLEKKVINHIIDLHLEGRTNCLYNILFGIGSLFEVTHKFGLDFDIKDEVSIYIYEDYYNELNQNSRGVFEFTNNLILTLDDIVDLLEYLHYNDYLKLLNSNSDSLPSIHQWNGYIRYNNYDQELQERLYQVEHKLLKPTKKLFELRNNNFEDEDTRKFLDEKRGRNTSNKLALFSTLVALGSMVSSVVFSYVTLFKDSKVKSEEKDIAFTLNKEDQAVLYKFLSTNTFYTKSSTPMTIIVNGPEK